MSYRINKVDAISFLKGKKKCLLMKFNQNQRAPKCLQNTDEWHWTLKDTHTFTPEPEHSRNALCVHEMEKQILLKTHVVQSNLSILLSNTNDILHRTNKNNTKVHMKPQNPDQSKQF